MKKKQVIKTEYLVGGVVLIGAAAWYVSSQGPGRPPRVQDGNQGGGPVDNLRERVSQAGNRQRPAGNAGSNRQNQAAGSGGRSNANNWGSNSGWGDSWDGGSNPASTRRLAFRLSTAQVRGVQARVRVPVTGRWDAATERAFQSAAAQANLPAQISPADFAQFMSRPGANAPASQAPARETSDVVARRLNAAFSNQGMRNLAKAIVVGQELGKAAAAWRTVVRNTYNRLFPKRSLETNMRAIATGMSPGERAQAQRAGFYSVANTLGVKF
jgi:hypothetical protein